MTELRIGRAAVPAGRCTTQCSGQHSSQPENEKAEQQQAAEIGDQLGDEDQPVFSRTGLAWRWLLGHSVTASML
jgi:hypothetical protein